MKEINIPLQTQILSEIRLPSGKAVNQVCKLIQRKPVEWPSEFQLDSEENLLDISKFTIDNQEFIGALTLKALFISTIKDDTLLTEKLELPKFLNNSSTNFKVSSNQILLYNENAIFYGEVLLNDQIELNFVSLESLKLESKIKFVSIVGTSILVIDQNNVANIFKQNQESYESAPSLQIDLQKIIEKSFDSNLDNLSFIHNEFTQDLLIMNPEKGIVIFSLPILINNALDQRSILFINIQNISQWAVQDQQLFVITQTSELFEINYCSTEVYYFINRRITLDKNFSCISMMPNQRFLYIFYEHYFIQFEHSIPKEYLKDDQVIIKFEDYNITTKEKILVATKDSKIFFYNNQQIKQLQLKQQTDLSCSLSKLKRKKIRQIEVKTLTKNCPQDSNNRLPFNSFCQQNLKIKFVKASLNETSQSNEVGKITEQQKQELEKKLKEQKEKEIDQATKELTSKLQEKFQKELDLKLQEQKSEFELHRNSKDKNGDIQQLKEQQQKELENKEEQLLYEDKKYKELLNETLQAKEQLQKQIEVKDKQYQEQLLIQANEIKVEYQQIINEKIQELQKQYVENIDLAKLPKIELNDSEIIQESNNDEETTTTIDTKFLLFFIVLAIIFIISTFYFRAFKQQVIKFARAILGVQMAQKVEETFNLRDELENQGIQLSSEDKKDDDMQGEEIFDANFDEI